MIGVDKAKHIYIAKVDKDDNAISVSEGKLGVGFTTVFSYKTPVTLSEVTMSEVKKIMENGSDNTVKATDDTDTTEKKKK